MQQQSVLKITNLLIA